MANLNKEILIFGSSGYLGSDLCSRLESGGFSPITYDRVLNRFSRDLGQQSVSGVAFVQGVNESSGLIGATNKLRSSLEANVEFVLKQIEFLAKEEFLSPTASIVIVSSIWQKFSRVGKVPYVVSKSAIEGLVRSLAHELGHNRRINAVLPGVIDSPMAKRALSVSQLRFIREQTPGGRLVNAREVVDSIIFLLSQSSAGINGQSIVLDRGWTSNIWLPHD